MLQQHPSQHLQQQQHQFQLQQQYHFQQHHQQQQQQLQMLQTYMQLQANNLATATSTPTKYQAAAAATAAALQQQPQMVSPPPQQQQQQYYAAAGAPPHHLTLIPAAACNGAAAVAAAMLATANATAVANATNYNNNLPASASATPTNINNNNVNNMLNLSARTSSRIVANKTATAAGAGYGFIGAIRRKSGYRSIGFSLMSRCVTRNSGNGKASNSVLLQHQHNGNTSNGHGGVATAAVAAVAIDCRGADELHFGATSAKSVLYAANVAQSMEETELKDKNGITECVDGSLSVENKNMSTGSSCSSASSNCSSMSSPSSITTTTTTSTTLHLTSPKKRGSDELLSQAAVMAPASDNNNQDLATKKAKLEPSTVLGGVGKPSKVIHLRNIPNESSESDVISLGVPFGRVTNVLVLKGKNQAFLEMADEVSATSMVSCYTVTPPHMRGRMVYVQFSNHRELKTDQSHNNSIVGTNDYRIQSPAAGSPLPLCNTTATTNADGTIAVLQNNSNAVNTNSTAGGPNTVLRVIVESLLYPVSLDILHQIFQRFGKVLKIVTFTKNNSFQALIQYPDAHSAQHAKTILDGQNIYNGCCTLRIDNSKLTALNVKYNNDKSRDFTNPSLPPGEPGADIMPTAGGLVNANDLLLIAARQRPSLTGDKIVNGLGAPGVLPPFALGIGTPLAGGYNSGIPNLGAFALANSGALQTATSALRGFSNVLLVSNLNEEMVTPDALFTLFGVYGDVQRVKILYNKKDSALIQMAEPQQAYLAMNHLDKLRLWGKAIRVMASKHQAVQLPKEGQPDAGLTRDYSQNPLHRFKKPGSKNYQNIYPPSATLHLSNIPSSCTEEDIKEAFTSNNFEVKAFKFFPKDRKMALIQLSSVEEAVLALIKMHNHQLSESNHLRVSFSKSNI
ncbi:polypyrimidine tract-binding protein 2 isoform X2 [Eurosta solidaginis]|uniref:polypyrimidine tract-binding protein 2 isoform X2 n=1 Tax=Eurosta solidaginis TaxID=178769 RepID=UPI003530E2E5